MEQHFTTKQVSLHSVSITYHCILQQRKPPEALQCPGTADWLFLQQQTLDLWMGVEQNECTEDLYFYSTQKPISQRCHKKSENTFLNPWQAAKPTETKALVGIPIIDQMNWFRIRFPVHLGGLCTLCTFFPVRTHIQDIQLYQQCLQDTKGKYCSMWINLWLKRVPNEFMNHNSG